MGKYKDFVEKDYMNMDVGRRRKCRKNRVKVGELDYVSMRVG